MAVERVLIIDDEPLMRKFLVDTFSRRGLIPHEAENGAEGLKRLRNDSYDLIITDVKMPGAGGMEILKHVKERSAASAVVMMTAYATVESAIEAMKMGAFDYLIKPFSPDQIELILDRINERLALLEENKYLKSELDRELGYGEIVGRTPVMQDLFEVVDKVAQSRATVLVDGESGTGKELVARAIHYNSPRRERPFIRVNCAALPESLLESEFFGHERGAFTGASSRRQGRFELADGGTLLLDEISEITPSLQAKLLRVLQEREFERIGGTKSIKVDVRIISTTNRDLKTEIEKGNFREDLYYRLNVIPVHLPPLREKHEDIEILAKFFLERYCTENNRPMMELPRETLDVMMQYRWPGNVRELENVIERAVVLQQDDVILAHHLALNLDEQAAGLSGVTEVGQTLAQMEKKLILKTLSKCKGNRGETSKVLDISVRTLRNKLSEYNVASKYKLKGQKTTAEKVITAA